MCEVVVVPIVLSIFIRFHCFHSQFLLGSNEIILSTLWQFQFSSFLCYAPSRSFIKVLSTPKSWSWILLKYTTMDLPPLSTFICHCCWLGGVDPNIYPNSSFYPFKASPKSGLEKCVFFARPIRMDSWRQVIFTALKIFQTSLDIGPKYNCFSLVIDVIIDPFCSTHLISTLEFPSWKKNHDRLKVKKRHLSIVSTNYWQVSTRKPPRGVFKKSEPTFDTPKRIFQRFHRRRWIFGVTSLLAWPKDTKFLAVLRPCADAKRLGKQPINVQNLVIVFLGGWKIRVTRCFEKKHRPN